MGIASDGLIMKEMNNSEHALQHGREQNAPYM